MTARRSPRRLSRGHNRRRKVPEGTAPEHLGCCGTRPAVDSLTETELRAELVADGVAGHATDLSRFVAACERIGYLSRRGADAAFVEVRDEIASLRGARGMPML